MIKAENINKIYGNGENEICALRDCTVSFENGTFSAITGASGSGKSTLLRIIGGLDTAVAGNVLYDETNILSLDDTRLSEFRRKNIGFVFQSFELIGELTAKENILLPLMLDKKRADGEYFDMLAKRLGIYDRLSHYPEQLSGGQQQRVAIARALINKPKVLLCDEPTGNLDKKNGSEVLELLLSLQAELGTTIIIVTHDENIASKAKNSIRLEDGQIISH